MHRYIETETVHRLRTNPQLVWRGHLSIARVPSCPLSLCLMWSTMSSLAYVALAASLLSMIDATQILDRGYS